MGLAFVALALLVAHDASAADVSSSARLGKLHDSHRFIDSMKSFFGRMFGKRPAKIIGEFAGHGDAPSPLPSNVVRRGLNPCAGVKPWEPQMGPKGGWYACCPGRGGKKQRMVYVSNKQFPWVKVKKEAPELHARLLLLKQKKGDEYLAGQEQLAKADIHAKETPEQCAARFKTYRNRYMVWLKGKHLATKLPPPFRSSLTEPGVLERLVRTKSDDTMHLDKYKGFQVWMSCAIKGAYRFEYGAFEDCGSQPRLGHFSKDRAVRKECQQSTGNAYPKVGGVEFDRGHLVPANHFDHDPLSIRQTNYMTNILPQAAKMNRGAWLATEELIECYRDLEPLRVVGGAVYSTDPAKDPRYGARSKEAKRLAAFQASHDLQAYPTHFWKIVRATSVHPEDFHVIAWWMPNDPGAVRGKAKDYIVSVAQLEELLRANAVHPETFKGLSTEAKAHKPEGMWPLPTGCNKEFRR